MFNKLKKRYDNFPIQVKASFCFLICSILQKGISFISTPIFTRIMSATEYGNYSVFNSWESIIGIFVTLNLSYGVYTQGLVKYENDQKKYSSALQGLTLFLVIVWTILYLVFRNFFNGLFSLNTTYMLLMIFSIWISAVFNFWASEQRVQYKYKYLVAITLFTSIASPILGILLIKYMEDKVLARILGTVVVYAVVYIWMFVSQMKGGKVFFSRKYWHHALNFNIPLIPHYLSQTILASSDRIMINKMVSSTTAGIYSLAYSIAMIMIIVNSALMQTISPWMYKKIKDKKIKDISKIAYPSLAIIAFVNILLIAFAPEAVKIFAPEEYYDAIWVIPPVAMSVYFIFAYDLFAKFEFYFEKTKLIATATVIGAIFNIILNYIFIKILGYYAAGYTTLICYILYALFHYNFMKKVCNDHCEGIQPYNTGIIIKITSVFLFFGFIFLFLYRNILLRYLFIACLILITIMYKKHIIEWLKQIIKIRNKNEEDVI